jgi:peptidyl-Lys metalloendopeptidase
MLIIRIALLLIVTGSSFAEGAKVKAMLSSSSDTFASDDPVIVKLKIRNKSRSSATILDWLTVKPPDAIDDIEANIFRVTLDGEPVDYLGLFAKRSPPRNEDYLVIQSLRQLTKKVDLSKFYDFSETGTYEVTYAAKNNQLFSVDGGDDDELVSNTLTLTIEGRPRYEPSTLETVQGNGKFRVTKEPNKPEGKVPKPTCTAAQQTVISAAVKGAKDYSLESYSYMLNLLGSYSTGSYPRYVKWFGVYDETLARANAVEAHFDKIHCAIEDPAVCAIVYDITFDCKCNKKFVYSYVYPDPQLYGHTIYLCGLFWQSPPTGADSQSGTIVHETSHFDDVAATEDYVYGQSNCITLAATDPDKAYRNADSQ